MSNKINDRAEINPKSWEGLKIYLEIDYCCSGGAGVCVHLSPPKPKFVQQVSSEAQVRY